VAQVAVCSEINTKHIRRAQVKGGTEVGVPLFPAVELCDFPGR